jgi:3-hydroxyisobutyrate dehydrogenase/glyoxylate/succinic semialdehyde reductase
LTFLTGIVTLAFSHQPVFAFQGAIMNVTFIGLGIMGSRMAANLLQGDLSLTVSNRSAAPVQSLKRLGAATAGSCRAAVAAADIVVTMLSTPEAVAQVAWSETGFIPGMRKDALWVDCSTVNPAFSLEAATIANAHGIRFMDAPVAGSKPQARSGELVFFAGGSAEDLEMAADMLHLMGSKVLHIGPVGQGAAMKMLVNAMLAQAMLAFSETLLLGEKLGLSRDFLLKILPDLPVCAPFVRAKAEQIRTDDYTARFPLELMHKDLHLAALTAYETGQPLPSANLAKEVYAAARQHGLGRDDFAAIFKFLSER